MATNKRTYPNNYFAWYNDEDRIAILTEDTTATSGERTKEKYDTFQGDGNLSGTITDLDGSGSTATATTGSTPHGLSTGDEVTISGTTTYNGDYAVTVSGLTTFTFSHSGSTSNEKGTFISLHVDKGIRIKYTAKYGTADAQTDDLKSDLGLDSGLHPSVVCYVKSRMFEDVGDLQKAQYFKKMFDKMVRQYPLRKSGVRQLSIPKL